MTDKRVLLPTNWLNGEPVPDDVRVLLDNRDELNDMTTFRFADCLAEVYNWAL